MTVVRLPARGRWVRDARGDRRAVRVSPHVCENVVNLSVWRDNVCVGTVRLLPAEVTALVGGLTEGLAELAGQPPASTPDVRDLEDRLARLEDRLARPVWRRAADAAADRARAVLGPRIRPAR
jgi:hypothetical protein